MDETQSSGDLGQVETLPESPAGDHVFLPKARVEAPQFVRRYQRERALGEGGMGAVWLCADRQIGRRVAMKVIRSDQSVSERAEKRFVREARVQGQLEHPAVVPVYDLGVDPSGAIYFTMKRIRGDTLEDIIAGGSAGYSRRQLLAAFARVCLAVDFAHKSGVLHRDLKPANIMLGDFGEVYVLDWGIAKLTDQPDEEPEQERVAIDISSETAPGALLGTPGYMSPEQILAKDDLGPASDVYSLGVVLFELLTGLRLHDQESLGAMIASTLDGADARPSVRAPDAEIVPELEAICVRATALNVEDRYPSARALHDDLERYLEGERDVQLRREMARAHADRARAAAQREGEGGLEERRTAMREIGRALALDPDDPAALEAMIGLLNTHPRVIPPEVRAEVKRARYDQHRANGRLGALTYGSLLLYLPLFFWIGIRDATPLYVLYGAASVTTLTSLWVARHRRPPTWAVVAVMIFSNVIFGAASAFYGWAILLPPITVANTIGFAIHFFGWYRWLAIACGSLVLIVPVILEATGVTTPSYAFVDGTIVVTSQAIVLDRVTTTVFVTLTSVTALLTGSLAVGGIRNSLREAEERLYLYAWHLRELIPSSARPATDPTRARPATPRPD